jgi:hypothetical protein
LTSLVPPYGCKCSGVRADEILQKRNLGDDDVDAAPAKCQCGEAYIGGRQKSGLDDGMVTPPASSPRKRVRLDDDLIGEYGRLIK